VAEGSLSRYAPRGVSLIRKGRFNISLLVEESKIAATKTKVITALTNLRNAGDIESGTWELTYEEIPEQGTV